MALYHLSVKTVSRSSGRSAVAAAAYRAGAELVDQRTGQVHDYTRKSGVLSTDLILPEGAPDYDRSSLWNAAEQAENRKNSTVAREFEIALPHGLTAGQRRDLALAFARALVEEHGCAADVAIHAPDTHSGTDERNDHAHILLTTRRIDANGFGAKTRELDDRKTGPALVTEWRERWADMQNEALEQANRAERVDHRSYAEQGIDLMPSIHLGPAANDMEKKGKRSSRGDENRAIAAHNAVIVELAELRAERDRQNDFSAKFTLAAAFPQLDLEPVTDLFTELAAAERAEFEAAALAQANALATAEAAEQARTRALFAARVLAAQAEKEKAEAAARAKAQAEKDKAVAQAAFEAKASARAEAERRVADLPRISNVHMTAGLTFGLMALKAIKAAGDNWEKVDWPALEKEVYDSLIEDDWEPEQALKAILEHSPARPALTPKELEEKLNTVRTSAPEQDKLEPPRPAGPR